MELHISLAPMEGLTTFIFRNALNKYYGFVDEYYSPFLTGSTLSFKEITDVSPDNNKSLILIPQILTNNTDTFFAIEKSLSEMGYTKVNLNLGCPSGTMVAKGRGAGQLKDLDKLTAFLDTVFSKTNMDISIKTRIGMYSPDEWEDIMKVYSQFPLSKLIIHPRVQKEFYEGTPHIEAYLKAKETLSFPLIYNGDIVSKQSYTLLLEAIPNTSDIMIGRGLLGNPELAGILKGNTSPATKETFKEFHNEILNGYIEYMSGDQPVLHKMKELWVFMKNYLDLSDKDIKAIKKTGSVAEYKSLINRLIAH